MSTAPSPACRRRVTIVNRMGIHARPAAMIHQRASRFHAEVMLTLVSVPDGAGTEPGTRADAKQVLEIMFLGAPQGSVVDVEAAGPDAEAAVAEVAGLMAGGFGEA